MIEELKLLLEKSDLKDWVQYYKEGVFIYENVRIKHPFEMFGDIMNKNSID